MNDDDSENTTLSNSLSLLGLVVRKPAKAGVVGELLAEWERGLSSGRERERVVLWVGTGLSLALSG